MYLDWSQCICSGRELGVVYKYMQKQNESALFAFSKVSHPYDATLPFQPELTYSQVLLGGLFVQGFRMFRKDQPNLCLIFVRRIRKETQYLFLKFTDRCTQPPKLKELEEVEASANSIRRLKGIDSASTFNYIVKIACLKQQKTVEMSNEEFQLKLRKAKENGPEVPSVEQSILKNPEQKKNKEKKQEVDLQCIDLTDGFELQKIKVFVWTYIDTFGGDKYKDNLYHQFQKNNNKSHLDIDRIINTVNWIIYCQTVDKPYTQLESSNWTCFEVKSKEKLRVDRKELVLTGAGRILYIPLLFICQKLEQYKDDCHRELIEVMQEAKKYYSEGQVKAYLITDQIDQHNLIYKTQSAVLHTHPDPHLII